MKAHAPGRSKLSAAKPMRIVIFPRMQEGKAAARITKAYRLQVGFCRRARGCLTLG